MNRFKGRKMKELVRSNIMNLIHSYIEFLTLPLTLLT